MGAGALKRASPTPSSTPFPSSTDKHERALLLQSTCATVVPKLVPQDLPVFRSLLQGVFPGADVSGAEAAGLREAVAAACARRQLVVGGRWVVVMDGLGLFFCRTSQLLLQPPTLITPSPHINRPQRNRWADKLLQLHQVLQLRHGVMLVGPTASGKTTAWRVLLEALAATEGAKVCDRFIYGVYVRLEPSIPQTPTHSNHHTTPNPGGGARAGPQGAE